MAYQKIESQDEYLKIVEQYKDYKAGTYKSMTLKEKIDFFDGIHTDNVPRFDEDGDDMDTAIDYFAIEEEFLDHPEQFSLNDILTFMEMLDDSCFQPSYMETTTQIIHNIVRFYQLDGVVFLLTHLHEVPKRSYLFGFCINMRLLIDDDITYPLMKEALKSLDLDTIKLIDEILNAKDLPYISKAHLEKKAELDSIIFNHRKREKEFTRG